MLTAIEVLEEGVRCMRTPHLGAQRRAKQRSKASVGVRSLLGLPSTGGARRGDRLG